MFSVSPFSTYSPKKTPSQPRFKASPAREFDQYFKEAMGDYDPLAWIKSSSPDDQKSSHHPPVNEPAASSSAFSELPSALLGHTEFDTFTPQNVQSHSVQTQSALLPSEAGKTEPGFDGTKGINPSAIFSKSHGIMASESAQHSPSLLPMDLDSDYFVPDTLRYGSHDSDRLERFSDDQSKFPTEPKDKHAFRADPQPISQQAFPAPTHTDSFVSETFSAPKQTTSWSTADFDGPSRQLTKDSDTFSEPHHQSSWPIDNDKTQPSQLRKKFSTLSNDNNSSLGSLQPKDSASSISGMGMQHLAVSSTNLPIPPGPLGDLITTLVGMHSRMRDEDAKAFVNTCINRLLKTWEPSSIDGQFLAEIVATEKPNIAPHLKTHMAPKYDDVIKFARAASQVRTWQEAIPPSPEPQLIEWPVETGFSTSPSMQSKQLSTVSTPKPDDTEIEEAVPEAMEKFTVKGKATPELEDLFKTATGDVRKKIREALARKAKRKGPQPQDAKTTKVKRAKLADTTASLEKDTSLPRASTSTIAKLPSQTPEERPLKQEAPASEFVTLKSGRQTRRPNYVLPPLNDPALLDAAPTRKKAKPSKVNTTASQPDNQEEAVKLSSEPGMLPKAKSSVIEPFSDHESASQKGEQSEPEVLEESSSSGKTLLMQMQEQGLIEDRNAPLARRGSIDTQTLAAFNSLNNAKRGFWSKQAEAKLRTAMKRRLNSKEKLAEAGKLPVTEDQVFKNYLFVVNQNVDSRRFQDHVLTRSKKGEGKSQSRSKPPASDS